MIYMYTEFIEASKEVLSLNTASKIVKLAILEITIAFISILPFLMSWLGL